MTNLNKELLINEFSRQNPWWKNAASLAEDIKKPKRDIYDSLRKKVMDSELITAITGLRRLGKTTIIKQIINDFLLAGFDTKIILYFSFDEFTLSSFPYVLENLIEYQLKRFPKKKLYFFLDEIQYIDMWNAVLKKYLDLYPQLKFVISGSSSLFIKTRAKETLAGRIQEMTMRSLSFSEYLRINCRINVSKTALFDFKALKETRSYLSEKFYDYLCFGEFPYLAKLSSFEERKEYVISWVIGKILEHDLPRIQKIIRAQELITLGNILIEGSGQLIELRNLAHDLGIARDTLSEYISLLEKSHLILQLFNLGAGFRTRKVRQRKIYATSVNAVVLRNTSGISSESFILKIGQIIETFVFNYLLGIGVEFYYWKQRELKEVDFIIRHNDEIIPLEVKYQNQIKLQDLKNLLYVSKKEKLKKAVVVTKDYEGSKKVNGVEILFLPAYYLV